MFIFGGWLLSLWATIQLRHCMYLEYPYLGTGIVFVFFGVVALFCVLFVARRRGYWRTLFLVPVVTGLWAMIIIPNVLPLDLEGSGHLSHVVSALDFFSKLHNRYPGDEAELRQAFTSLPRERSLYRKNGQEVPFRLVLIANAAGPFLGDPGKDPGVMFYAVSLDRQEAWLTATELSSSHPVGNHVRFVDFFSMDGDPRVFHRRVSQQQSP
jgi:hypothetical protein